MAKLRTLSVLGVMLAATTIAGGARAAEVEWELRGPNRAAFLGDATLERWARDAFGFTRETGVFVRSSMQVADDYTCLERLDCGGPERTIEKFRRWSERGG